LKPIDFASTFEVESDLTIELEVDQYQNEINNEDFLNLNETF
jgi:hypothetical protein